MAVTNRAAGAERRDGRLPLLYAATRPDLRAGSSSGPTGSRSSAATRRSSGLSSAARDEATAERLWSVSEELTGVVYEFR